MTIQEVTEQAHIRLVCEWVNGWALARGTALPVADRGGFRVDVGWPQQTARYIFPRLTEDVSRFADAISDPWIYLKVCAPPDQVGPVLPPRWTLQPPSYMMVSEVAAEPEPLPPPGYRIALQSDPPVSRVEIRAENGDVAASGHEAVVRDFIIYDRIETHADHRRRGLGRSVMGALTRLGRQQGGTQGVLVATADGRALYQTLGWRTHAPYTSAVIQGRV